MVTQSFVMQVTDLFRLSDGETVFTGIIQGGPSYIGTCRCELLMDSVPVASVLIVGERMPGPYPPASRSLSTRDPVPIDRDDISQKSVELIYRGSE